MRIPILMPRNSCAQTWIFDEEDFIKRREILSINGLCNAQ